MKDKVIELLRQKTNIDGYVDYDDYYDAMQYSLDSISFISKIENNKINRFIFNVEDKYTGDIDRVQININKKTNQIISVSCSCDDFYYYGNCCHVLAVFINYYKEIFNFNDLSISKLLLDKYNIQNKPQIKKEVKVELSLKIYPSNYYYGEYYGIDLDVLIGEKKMYKATKKLNYLKEVYYSGEGELRFGKDFTYNPEEHYFTKETEELLNIIFLINDNKYVHKLIIKKYLKDLSKLEFNYNGYKNYGIKNEFPLKTKLEKTDNDNFVLTFNTENIDEIFEDDYEYITYQGQIYKLNSKEQELLADIMLLGVNSINIKKDEINKFSTGMLKLIKNNIEINDNISEIKLAKNIQTELYFDLRNNYILCNPRFLYDNESVNYFDTTSAVIRDNDYEASVINDLLKYKFQIDKNLIRLDDIEDIVYFIEQGLEDLASNYVIYTTEKFKSVNVKKKTNISSTFGIGQDNILSFGFNLGDIDNNEIVNIFKELKNKKKYYLLKNGDILNLEDKNLNELEELADDLELTDEEIIAGRGTLQKYRAIYLDSLKNTKYNIIQTDNLFDNFIANFYKYKDAKLSISADELSVLRDYQLIGTKWLYNLAKTGFGGILADEMGLGKTIQVIYYIKQILKDDINKKVLIVVPTSLAYNWEKEFDTFASEITKAICVGKKEIRQNILNRIDDYNVLVTTYGLLREDYDLYKDLTFDTMVIDEAQNIKNNLAGITKCVKGINATTKFALTGTPLENSVLELWSIFDFIMPGYLASLTKFQSKYRIKDFNEDTDILIKNLSRSISPFILRRKKEDVVKELPEKLVNDIYIELDEKQKILYAAELENVKKQIDEAMATGGMSKVRFIMLTLLTKLRQLCIDPHILYENYDGNSNKLDTLCNIVEEYIKNNHKILIFSSFRTGLELVKKRLEKNKISCYTINGSVSSKKRQELVDSFNDDASVNVFLIMLKSGGTGLNLTGADVVIHLDLWWNPQAENQATDRAHRIGQTNTVEVIHLIMKGTIEEKILELQNKKRMLSDKLIDGEVRDKNMLSDLTEEDIKNLLSYENAD